MRMTCWTSLRMSLLLLLTTTCTQSQRNSHREERRKQTSHPHLLKSPPAGNIRVHIKTKKTRQMTTPLLNALNFEHQAQMPFSGSTKANALSCFCHTNWSFSWIWLNDFPWNQRRTKIQNTVWTHCFGLCCSGKFQIDDSVYDYAHAVPVKPEASQGAKFKAKTLPSRKPNGKSGSMGNSTIRRLIR